MLNHKPSRQFWKERKMLKKVLAGVLVSALFFVPTMAIAFSPGNAPTFSANAGAGGDKALLGAAIKGDTAFEAEALSSDEMQAVEGARRKTPKWLKTAGKVVVVGLAVIGAVVIGHGAAGADHVAY
jgi:hypothetical protein